MVPIRSETKSDKREIKKNSWNEILEKSKNKKKHEKWGETS